MKTILLTLCVALGFCATAQNFGTGNFVVLRAGDGTTPLTANGNKIFLDEYSASGVFVRSIEMPSTNTAPLNNIVTNGTNNTEGNISRSPNGLYITFAAYNTLVPIPFTSSVAAATSTVVPRLAAWLANNGIINSLSISDWCSASSPRTAVTTDATQFWLGGGAGGVCYRAASGSATVTVSTTVTSVRNLIITNGNLYASSTTGTPKLGIVGSGIPTSTGQTIAGIAGYPSSNVSPHQFVLLDLNPSIDGPDVLYVADEIVAGGGAGAIRKYSYNGTTWTYNGQIGVATDIYRGIIANANGSAVTIFATRNSGAGAGGGAALVTTIDNAGYNMAPSSTTPTIIDTLTNVSQKAFRGLAWAPTATALPVNLQSFNARLENGTAKLWWATSNAINAKKFEIEKSTDGNRFTYLSSVTATNGSSLISYTFDDASLTGIIVYYRLKIIDNDGTFAYSNIINVPTNATSALTVRLANNPVIGDILYLLHSNASKISNINIFSTTGNLVKSFKAVPGTKQSNVNVASLPKGQYFIEYTDAENNINATIKFIK